MYYERNKDRERRLQDVMVLHKTQSEKATVRISELESTESKLTDILRDIQKNFQESIQAYDEKLKELQLEMVQFKVSRTERGKL